MELEWLSWPGFPVNFKLTVGGFAGSTNHPDGGYMATPAIAGARADHRAANGLTRAAALAASPDAGGAAPPPGADPGLLGSAGQSQAALPTPW